MHVEILLSDRKTHGKRAPSFQARIFAGPVLCRSQTPIYDGARAMLEMGYPPETEIVAWHEDGLIKINNPQTIGYLSKWTVVESEKGGLQLRKWAPHFRQKADS